MSLMNQARGSGSPRKSLPHWRRGGVWLSLIGSTEGPPREVGPPRRSAREVALAIEPVLEIVELRSAQFVTHDAKAWFCLARQRSVPAQPSSRRD
jgi:hypothetical protein